jgi:hypothetical protein
MKKLILDCFSGSDNSTLDIGRIIWFMGACVYLWCTLCNCHTFNGIEFGTGFGGLLVTGAGALRLKQNTEPK